MKLRKISSFLSAVLLSVSIWSTPVPALTGKDIVDEAVEIEKSENAGEKMLTAADTGSLGSITVKLQDTNGNLSIKGVSLALTKVADVVGGKFKIRESFASSGIDLNTIQNANELEAAASKLSQAAAKNTDVTLVTDGDGEAKADNLSAGVYLLRAVDIAGYENITPLLAAIPTFLEESGEMTYDLEILPKHTPLPQPVEKSLPQTGIDNKAFEYALISAGFFVLSGAVIAISKSGKRSKAGN